MEGGTHMQEAEIVTWGDRWAVRLGQQVLGLRTLWGTVKLHGYCFSTFQLECAGYQTG